MQEKIKPYFNIIKITIFFILISIFLFFIIKNISLINLELIIQYKYTTLTIILLASLLILLKSFQLKAISDIFTKQKSYFHFIKTYCMSSFIELTTFTGKIGSDGFKYIHWSDLSKKERISIIIIQRSADIIGFIFLFLIFFKPLLLIPVIITFISTYTYLKYKKKENVIIQSLSPHLPMWSLMLIISIISYIIIATQLSLIFHTLGAQVNKTILSGFLFSHAAGAISQLPLGIGVKDLSLAYILKDTLSPQNIILGLIWIRLCGEFISISLGAIFFAASLKQSSKETIPPP